MFYHVKFIQSNSESVSSRSFAQSEPVHPEGVDLKLDIAFENPPEVCMRCDYSRDGSLAIKKPVCLGSGVSHRTHFNTLVTTDCLTLHN